MADLPKEASAKEHHLWGRGNISSRQQTARHLKDLPEVEVHRLQSGHFAVEDYLTLISAKIKEFYDKKVRQGR
jgi:hypothetical protein